MRNQLITLFGGGGFLGRYVAQELLRAGARVRIAQRDPRQAWFLKTQGGLGQTQFVAADLTHGDSVARAVAGAQGVVNLVGTFGAKMQAIHVEGAGRVARAAADAGASTFVQISAIGADPQSPSQYGQTKAAGEAAVREGFANATILRPSIVFGREDQFVNRFADMIAKAPIVPVLAPDTRFQPVHVVDVARAVVGALDAPARHGGRTYELGGPDVLTMAELFRWIAQATGRENKRMVELPEPVGALLAAMPGTPISRDQWAMLGRDNVVADGAAGLSAFDIVPTPLETVAPEWLVRYRRGGRFGTRTALA